MPRAPAFTEFVFWWEKEKIEESIGHSNRSLEPKSAHPAACPSRHSQNMTCLIVLTLFFSDPGN